MVNWCCRYYQYQETGFYYLQSRYYDPEICRFINADSFATTDIDGLLSTNMFSYCENNPVIHSDPSGEFLEAVIGGAIAGAIIGAASTAINAMVTGVPITLKDVAIGAGKGAINGAVSGALSGLMAVKAIAKLPKLAKAAIRLGGSAANAVLAAHTTIKSGGSKREAVFAATTTFIGTAIGTKLPSPSSKDLFSVKTAYNVITGFYFGGSLEAFSSIIQGVIYRSRSR